MNSPVVDACIARSAGKGAAVQAVQALLCLEALKLHEVVITFTDELLEEWTIQQSSYSTKWLASRSSQKLLKVIKSKDKAEALNRSIEGAVPKANLSQKKAMLKDAHLFWAGIASGKIIISYNIADAKLFKKFLSGHVKLCKVNWVDPITHPNLGDWIKNGLKLDKSMEISSI